MQERADTGAATKPYLLRALLALFLLTACLAAARATEPEEAQQAWLTDQLRRGQPLDFAQKCDLRNTDPAARANADACRTVSGATIAKLLTGQVVAATAWPLRGLELSHALIDGPLDLTGAHVTRRISIRNSEFSGAATLSDSIFDQSLTLECDVFDGGVQGLSLQVGGNFSLQASHFVKNAFFVGLRTGGFLWAGSTAFDDGANFGNAQIGLTFSMNSVNAAFCGGTGPLIQATAPHGFALDAAQIGGNLGLEGSYGHTGKHDAISAHGAHIHGLAGLQVTADGGVDLGHATIDGTLYVGGTKLTGTFKAAGSHIGDDVTLSGGAFGNKIDFSDASLGRGLILHGVLRAEGSTGTLMINLQNAHIVRLSDDSQSWQGEGISHYIAGMTYDSLVPPDPMIRPARDWRREWLSSDQSQKDGFDPQPYQELASVLTLSGDKDGAINVMFWARQKERDMAYQHGHWARYLGLTAMLIFVGYGIGNYIFLALIWVVVITAAGAIVLGWSKEAHGKGRSWRIQASLDRLLPIIQLSPSFDEFFRESDKKRLHSWQLFFFSCVAIAGWVLGAFLAAAVSGLTQGGP